MNTNINKSSNVKVSIPLVHHYDYMKCNCEYNITF